MKQPKIILLFCFWIGLLVMGISACLINLLLPRFPGLAEADWPAQLLPAAGWMLAAVAAHLLARKRIAWVYLLSYYGNAVASGWAIGVLFVQTQQTFPPAVLFPMLLPAALLGLFAAFVAGKRFGTGIPVILAAALLLGGIALWIWWIPLIGCVTVFSALFLLPFPLGLQRADEQPQNAYRSLSFTGFGAFFLILLAVILILSEGDGLDVLDFDFGGGKKRRKQNTLDR